ncbi:MAG: SpoIIE family protein phosphatase [Bacteroidales bacterium]|nr:SpoIIE family protein phosphatase [Bacteroidales bacterium]
MRKIFNFGIGILTSTILYLQGSTIQEQLKFRHYTTEEGMSHNQVYSVCQDHYGIMWFGTNKGLTKFDGYNFTIYKPDINDSASIQDILIRALYKDSKNTIWIGGQHLSYYERDKDHFINLSNIIDSIVIEGVNFFYEDSAGFLWISTTNGLFSYNLETKKVKSYFYLPDDPNSISSININRIMEDSYGNFWICTRDGALEILNRETGKFKHFFSNPNNNKTISENHQTAIFQDSKGILWIGTYNNGLNRFNYSDSTFERIIIDKENSFSNRVRDIYEDTKGNLWFGTRGGLYLYNYKKNSFNRYAHTEHIQSKLSHNSIFEIFEDNNQGLWITTFAGGVNYADLNQKKFITYTKKPDDNYFLNDAVVYSFAEDKNKNIWVGTEQGGINILNIETGKFSYLSNDPENPNSLCNNDIKKMVFDNHSNLWIGTYDGLDYYNTKTKTFTHYKADKKHGSLTHSRIYEVFIDSKNNLWISNNAGINLMKKGSKNFINAFSSRLYSIIEDNEKNILAANGNIIMRFNYMTNQFEPYFEITEKSQEVNLTNVIYQDSKGNFWFGRDLGITYLNNTTKDIINYEAQDGLYTYAVYGIIEDNNKNLWLSGNNGLVKFVNAIDSANIPNFKIYLKADGLQGKQFNYNAYFKAADGKIYFGGIKGFSSFYPEMIIENKKVPNVIITNINIFNKPVEIDQKIHNRIIINKSISELDHVILSYKDYIFGFEFAGIHYSIPEKNNYAYYIEGFENEWNYTDAIRRLANYTNLPGGDYVFKVKAANCDGIWNEDPIELKVTIQPPFWRTWWFIITLTLFIIGSAITFYFIRINQIKRQKEELEKQVAIRTHELKEANSELKMQKEEILTQNEEIQQQSEELATQRDALEEQNKKIETAYKSIQLLSEFGKKVTSTLNLDAINDIIYNYVNSLMDAAAFGIGIYCVTKKAIEYTAFFEKGEKKPYFNLPVNKKNSLAIWCFKNRKEILINDYESEHKKYIDKKGDFKTSEHPQSAIYLPLTIENRAIGVVTVQSYKKNAYSENDINNLQSLASYISIALDNANVYDIIKEQNIHIKSSIEYAKSIQNSILPTEKDLNKYLNYFIIFKPRDIVSGDFYWFLPVVTQVEKEQLFFAVADCTGHGVPGAFMSLIGNRLLNEIVNQKRVLNPAQILELLNVGVSLALKQDQTDNNDGMDVCLCRFEKEINNRIKICFSGAKRPLYYYKKSNNKIEILKGDRKSIGGIRAKRSKLFYTNKELIMEKEDIIYLSSDGFVDQNAPNRKKFGTYKLLNILENIKDDPLEKQKEKLEKEIMTYMENTEQRDDITLIGLKF